MDLTTATVITGLVFLRVGFFLKRNRLTMDTWVSIFRNKKATIIFHLMASAWFLYKVLNLSQADFGQYRYPLFLFFSAIAYFAYFYIPDFLLIRALSIIGLLSSDLLLKAAYMEPFKSRLILVVAAYLIIIVSLFLGAMPFLIRDFIGWVYKKHAYYVILVYFFIIYGLALLMSIMNFL